MLFRSLTFARVLRAEFERQGWRVVLTRPGNENPSFDDRAAIANAERDAVFLSLHVSSTGAAGTARAYYFDPAQFEREPAAASSAEHGLLRWELAQAPFVQQSRRLAEFLQVQLAQKFRGTPEVATPCAVRQLRTIVAPAVAIEVSSISADPATFGRMAAPLAEAASRALAAFRQA